MFIIQNLNGSGNKLSKLNIQEESTDDLLKKIRNLLKLKKENKAIKDKTISNVRNLFELEN